MSVRGQPTPAPPTTPSTPAAPGTPALSTPAAAPAAHGPGVHPAAWGVMAVGALVVLAGLWLIGARRADRSGRSASGEGDEPPRGLLPRAARWREGLSEGTRLALGMAAALAGYHAMAWAAPAGWFWLHVPWERAWLLLLALGAGVGASLMADRLERTGEGPERDGARGE